jgi:hypothetical protein
VKKTRWGVACGSTHELDGRDGIQTGHGAAVLVAGSGAVKRRRRLPDADQSVAQFSNRDAFNQDHGTGAERTRQLVDIGGRRIDAWWHDEQ